MAFPFEQAPTLAEYLDWARSCGCRDQCGYSSGPDGPIGIVRIEAPDGRYVIEALTQDERLLPSTIKRLDERLGIQSPFFKMS